MRLLHQKLTYNIRKCIYDVHNELKPGFDEESYHLALEKSLQKRNISYTSKPNLLLKHRGIVIHKFIPDLIVEDKVVLELKSTKTGFVPANYVQIISYLKHTERNLGLLVNFGCVSAKIERILHFEREIELDENYLEIEDFIVPIDEDFEGVRTSLINILKLHGLNYDYSIYQSLFQAELTYQNISFSPNVLIPIEFDGETLRNYKLKVPVVANKILCGITAGQPNLKIHKASMRNYLKKTNLPFGIIANFKKDLLELLGVHP